MAADLITAKQAAEELGVSYETILRWLKDGKPISGFKIGQSYRVRRADVNALLNGEAVA